MSTKACTPAPPPPPNGPSDWADAVQGNCFSNIERLGLWTGGTAGLLAGADPSQYFQQVTPGSLGGGDTPPTIYVLAHGWAPGFRSAVNAQGGNLLWWGSEAYNSDGVWASDWAWTPVEATSLPLQVNPTGLLQSIAAQDPNAVVLAYSWIDDSATDSGDLYLYEVYRSEAYTHVNGIRLADALEQAIAPSFWDEPTGLLRLIGHSHGSKVATVAALTLQQRGRRVAHLTVLDAPESDLTLDHNASNLLGFYLEQMQIANPSYDCAAGAFVDNYASYFGVGYAGTPNLKNVVEVALDPYELYPLDDAGDKHSYAAAWYGGAAAGASAQGEPPLGLAWPPPPKTFRPALNQNWPGGTDEFNQWQLQAGTSIGDSFSYSTQPLAVTTVSTQGSVQGEPSTKLTFGPNGGDYSIFQGSYYNSDFGDGYGIAVDILWIAPQTGDYLVVTMESPDLGVQEVLLVLDGQSAPVGQTSVAINSDVSSVFDLDLYIYFLAANSYVTLSNFRLVEVGSASGYLRARRLAEAGAKSAKRTLREPRAGKLSATAER
jgi:Thioesterase domain